MSTTTAPPAGRTRKRRGKSQDIAAPPKRAGSVADLFDVQAIEQDGMFINSAGEYVRVIECQTVPNVISADPTAIERIEDGWAELCSSIPNRQRIAFYAQNDPIPIDDAMRLDRENVEIAAVNDLEHDRPDLAQMRRRFLYAERQSVMEAARGDQPAVATRYWIAVPWTPESEGIERVREVMVPSGGSTVAMTWEKHQRAARESLRYTEMVAAHLAGMGIDPHVMGPVEILALGWERLHPASNEIPDLDAFARVADYVRHTSPEQARAHRQAIVDAVTSGDSPCGIDDRDPRRLRHADGTLEETVHLGTQPVVTNAWWLSLLLAVPLPCTVAVHVSAGDRATVRQRYRRRWARLRSAIAYKERRGQLVGHDELEALEEARDLDGDLSSTVNATVYDVSVYASYRHPGGSVEEFDETVDRLAKQFEGFTDAKVIRGRAMNLPGFESTMPLGKDRLRATRRYAHRNIANLVPLTTAACGSPDGLMLGFSDPGGTLERINPYDSLFQTHVTLVAAPSGGGKTVMMNTLAARAIAQGMRGYIIDRSSTRQEHGTGRGQGHYSALMSLVPDSRTVQVGGGAGDVINPWDVPDLEDVSSEKTEFLLALHALLIGDTNAAGEKQLNALEESLLTRAITDVYRTCRAEPAAGSPRETLLIRELEAQAEVDDADPGVVSTLRALIAKLHPYTEGQSLAHIADLPTTVKGDPPLTLFDIAGAPDRLTPALILTIVDHIDHAVQRTRARHVAGTSDDLGPWAGRMFLIVEEGWKITGSPASGAWLNEYARRSRHYALWLIFVSQHFKDLDNEQGRALMENASLRLNFRNERKDLEYARESGGYTQTDIDAIASLTTRKGVYSTVYVVSPRGRGRVRILLGNLEYWTCSNDPDRDQPLRRAALADSVTDEHPDGDPWKALRLLCTPAWHDQQAERVPG